LRCNGGRKGSSCREDEAAQALERGGGIGKMGGGSGSRSRKKMAKVVSRKYAFVAGTRVPSGARAYWASKPAGPRTVIVQLGLRMRVGRWASRVEKGEKGQTEIEEGLGSCLNGI
jgi:hypothetical protein